MFPYRQEAFVDAKMVVLIVVRSLAVNTNLPDSLFDPDASAAASERARVAFLGTSAALTSAGRDNTSLVFEAAGPPCWPTAGAARCTACSAWAWIRSAPPRRRHARRTSITCGDCPGSCASSCPRARTDRCWRSSAVPSTLQPLARAADDVSRAGSDPMPLKLVPIDLAVGARAFTSGRLRVSTTLNPHGLMMNFAVRGRGGVGRRRRLFVRHAAERQRGGAVPRSRHADPRRPRFSSETARRGSRRRRPFERGRGRPGRHASGR